MTKQGMTLIEILITILIIGMVAAIAIPAVTQFGDDAREKVCRQNLRTIDNTKLQWAIDKDQPDDAEPTEEDLGEYIKGDFPQAVVAGALYRIGNVITPALCSYHGNHFTEGFGLSFSPSITELVKSGKLSASDVVDGDWEWRVRSDNRVGFSTIYTSSIKFFLYESSISKHRSAQLSGIGDVTPEINVNGKVLKGNTIDHYSKESIDRNKEILEEAHERLGVNICSYLLQMDEGGGYVVHGSDVGERRGGFDYAREYYDHKGKLLGYITKRYTTYDGLWKTYVSYYKVEDNGEDTLLRKESY